MELSLLYSLKNDLFRISHCLKNDSLNGHWHNVSQELNTSCIVSR